MMKIILLHVRNGLNTRFPVYTLLYAGYSLKLIFLLILKFKIFQIESLKQSNIRLEEEAAELAALRAQAALADTLSGQLQR